MPHPNLTTVNSSNIAAVGYFGGKLVVEFLIGTIYAYDKVPEDTYVKLMAASSHGTFINSEIKGKFNFTKITATDVDQMFATSKATSKKARKTRNLDFATIIGLNPYLPYFF